LKGRFYANVFIHFEPVGHSLRHKHSFENPDVEKQYREALAKGQGGHENHDGLPSYIVEGSEEATRYKRSHRKSWKPSRTTSATTGSTDAHTAAQTGDVQYLEQIAKREKDQLTKQDSNGWAPIHEGARAGHTEVLKVLVKHGVNMNERTNKGKGGSPLYYATSLHGKRHASVQYLQSIGAEYIEPEL